MSALIRNADESRWPERDEDGRVALEDCEVVEASFMLPAGTTATELRALMERIYGREPTVLHWSTNWVEVETPPSDAIWLGDLD